MSHVSKLTPEISEAFQNLKAGARQLRTLSTDQKNQILLEIAQTIQSSATELLIENAKDLQSLPADTLTSFRDRLTLNPNRIAAMVESLRQVAALKDPVGEEIETRTLGNGLRLRRVRAPLGVIFMIFESRPNVILEAFSLAFKSGNVIALRGGSDSSFTARFLYSKMNQVITQLSLASERPAGDSGPQFFYGFNDYHRDWVRELLARKDWIDVVVPRGGEKLIAFVQEHARMPIIKNDRGMCHAFVDQSAQLPMAVEIVLNAKTQRPGVCNSLETVLVHSTCAESFYDQLVAHADRQTLQFRACPASFQWLEEAFTRHHRTADDLKLASDEDWDTEHLDLILNCKVVADLPEALAHIERHSSRHSETIITQAAPHARQFQTEIDSAAVYWNASTRFTDGFEFGLGGELGISTQKLHTRGPIGLNELTTPRWLIDGTGQTRI